MQFGMRENVFSYIKKTYLIKPFDVFNLTFYGFHVRVTFINLNTKIVLTFIKSLKHFFRCGTLIEGFQEENVKRFFKDL
jgi:hypothetical protein